MNKARRKFVKAFASGTVVIPLSWLASARLAQAADLPQLNPESSAAKALGYTQQSADANKLCSGCQFYTGAADAGWGPCVLFPKNLVNAGGVCNSWFKRAG
jgi:hypothetical protein